jgi:hypothetical protein
VLTEQQTDWDPDSMWTIWGTKKNLLAVPEIDPSSFDFPGNSLTKIPNEKLQLPATSKFPIITEEK